MLADADEGEAAVIDPGGRVDDIAVLLQRYDLRLRYILHTHGHFDHAMDTKKIHNLHGGEVAIHGADRELYDLLPHAAAHFGLRGEPPPPPSLDLEHEQRLPLGAWTLRVIHTPGHTPGGVCFEVKDGERNILVAGDTLFRRAVGRTDLPGGDSEALARSIRERLYVLDPDTLVIPGHGPTTTIGEEREKNRWVRAT